MLLHSFIYYLFHLLDVLLYLIIFFYQCLVHWRLMHYFTITNLLNPAREVIIIIIITYINNYYIVCYQKQFC